MMPKKRMECFKLLFDNLAWIEYQFLSGTRNSRKAGSLSIDQSWLAKGLGLGLLCWGFKGVQEEIPSEDASTLKIGQWHFHQNNAPVHNSILVTVYLTKMGLKTVRHPPFSPDLAPCDFWLLRQLRRWKRLWRRSLTRSHQRTSMGPSRRCWNGTTSGLQPEEITSMWTRVSCMYYQ